MIYLAVLVIMRLGRASLLPAENTQPVDDDGGEGHDRQGHDHGFQSAQNVGRKDEDQPQNPRDDQPGWQKLGTRWCRQRSASAMIGKQDPFRRILTRSGFKRILTRRAGCTVPPTSLRLFAVHSEA